MKENITKKKLLNGKPVIGTFVTLSSTEVVHVLSKADYDCLMIDGEHGAMDFNTLGQQIITAENFGADPLVRISSSTEDNIKKALDAGAYGIMLPMVKNGKEVEDFVEKTYFPPKGTRGNGSARANDYFINVNKYLEFQNSEILRIIQIETREAVENIDEILSVDGIDIVFVGPYDLSFSLGTPDNIDSKEVTEAIETVALKCAEYGKIAGIMSNEKKLKVHLDLGYKFILSGLDGLLLYSSARKDVENFKRCIEDFD